jgi:hypothetical protein
MKPALLFAIVAVGCASSGCGSSEATPAAVDASVDAVAIDAAIDVAAVDAAPDVVDAAAPPKRVMSISVSPRLSPPPTASDFLDAWLLADGAGARGAFVSKTWRDLEPTAGTFSLDSLASDVDFAGNQRGHAILVGVQVLNTTAKATPSDLAMTSFDAPEMKSRFHALVDALLPKLNSHVKWLSIGNEVDVYLGAHPGEWATYESFLRDAFAYVRAKAPQLSLAVTFTFEGARGTNNAAVAQLNAASDALVLTYYPLGAMFAVKDPALATADVPQMVTLAAGKPLVLQEVGYPSSTMLGSSEDAQSQLVANVLTAWQRQGGAKVPFVNFFLEHDLTSMLCDQYAQYYGLGGDANFKAYLCSLGLRQSNGTAKKAWGTLVTQARATGLPE